MKEQEGSIWDIDFGKDHFSLIPTIGYENLYIAKIIGFYWLWLSVEFTYGMN